jgi:hypothetical protein
MRNIINEINHLPHTEQREVQIGKTIYEVKSVFKGEQSLDKLLLEWAVKKTLAASNS